MKPEELMGIMPLLEKMKCNLRHSYLSSGRAESVAEHSWRMAVMAMLIKDEFPGMDMERVIKLCLIHDLGEAVTGDVASFLKTDDHRKNEAAALEDILSGLPSDVAEEFAAMFAELEERQTPEARLCKALDRLEAVVQHNEADTATWLPLEHDLQLQYGAEETAWFPYTTEGRRLANEVTKAKTAEFFNIKEKI